MKVNKQESCEYVSTRLELSAFTKGGKLIFGQSSPEYLINNRAGSQAGGGERHDKKNNDKLIWACVSPAQKPKDWSYSWEKHKFIYSCPGFNI